MKWPTCGIFIESQAWEEALIAAGRAPQRETGGILLGGRLSEGIRVTAMFEVPDHQAGHAAYRRRHGPAEVMLQEALESLPDGSPVGYVGEWHVHPAPVGPSWVDLREVRRISKKAGGPVALVVCVASAAGPGWSPLGLCAADGRLRRGHLHLIERTDDG
jgi:hypothetical protein